MGRPVAAVLVTVGALLALIGGLMLIGATAPLILIVVGTALAALGLFGVDVDRRP